MNDARPQTLDYATPPRQPRGWSCLVVTALVAGGIVALGLLMFVFILGVRSSSAPAPVRTVPITTAPVR